MLEGLGRIYSYDDRDDKFSMGSVLPRSTGRTFRYWNSNRWWGDQGGTSQCVAYSWAHLIERPDNDTTPWRSKGGHVLQNGSWVYSGQVPQFDLDLAYAWAQQNDEWPGTDYNGTSVRAGAKYLQKHGHIDSYYWGRDVNTIAQAILDTGPVAVGTMWTMDMFITNRGGFITPTGEDAGGHAYLLDGVNTRHKFFRIKNSWGRNWGYKGFAKISFADFDKLLQHYGEACIVVR
ncbi:MAG: hypothetical protein LC650_00240 [Actinobacteria bacterium]|nr:hypothetical protein [Actinomycetota bacterium]